MRSTDIASHRSACSQPQAQADRIPISSPTPWETLLLGFWNRRGDRREDLSLPLEEDIEVTWEGKRRTAI